jgi:hypothetical protein
MHYRLPLSHAGDVHSTHRGSNFTLCKGLSKIFILAMSRTPIHMPCHSMRLLIYGISFLSINGTQFEGRDGDGLYHHPGHDGTAGKESIKPGAISWIGQQGLPMGAPGDLHAL